MSFNINKIHELYPEAEKLMIEPMLVWKLPSGKESMLSEICSNNNYFLEEKIDGAFYQFVKTEHYSYLFGRTVSKTSGILTEKSANVPHLKNAFEILPPNTILIGEIYVPGGTSKDVVSIMGCLPELAIKRQENNPIHYYIHDIIFYDGVNLMGEGAESRYSILEAIWKKHALDKYDFLRLAVKVDNNLEEEISRILQSGGEGAVLKKKNYPYTPGKRPAWSTIKIKQMDSIDLVCMGFCPPTKEYTGKELETWEYWEEQGEILSDGTFQWHKNNYNCYNDYIHNPHIYKPITKYYYYGWPSAIEIGIYNEKQELVKIGTVSSGLTDEMKKDMAEHPENYLHKVVELSCMQKLKDTIRHPVFVRIREDKKAEDCTFKDTFG